MIPARPFIVFDSTVARTRRGSPRGETAWAHTHVPQRTRGDAGAASRASWDAAELETFTRRVEAEVEAQAPGFRS